MCGISGFNWKDEGRIDAMADALSYRGPDARGVYTDNGISLGHNRLSIIDLSEEANQPMHDNLQELVIVFNGEIYNFQDLRRELEGEYEFRTKGDTEVILAGYRKWGKDVVDKLNGMFAFAIWDKRDSSLFCARDHAGIKPFYYFWDGKKLIFASEIPSILMHDIPRKLSKEAFSHYLRVLYAPEPLTMIENIFKLPPGHILMYKGGKVSIDKYDTKEPALAKLSYTEAVDTLRGKVIDAVGRQLIADVPVGIYLSGGIDSSTVLFSMSQFRKNIQTFSVGFDLTGSQEAEKFNQDFELAKRTAEFFGAEHHPILVSGKDVLNHFEEMSMHNSDPISHPTAVPMMLLARFARERVTVVLTGSGGDELFGGYERYRNAVRANYYKKLPAFMRSIGNNHPKISKLDYGRDVDFFARVMFEKDKNISKIINQNFFNDGEQIKKYFESRYFSADAGDIASKLMRADQASWLPDYFFMLSDKMSMASGLEERVPLTDKELWYFSKELPREYKVDLFKTKKILKDAFRQDLPEFLFKQPKRGWFAPGAKWLREPDFARFAQEVLSQGYYGPTEGLFNWLAISEMLESHIEKREYNLTILWAILSFQVWAKQYRIQL